MNFETIAVTAVVGLLTGWLSGFVMKRGGYGTITDTVLGVAGGVMGGFALSMQAIAQAGSWFAIVAAAFAGAFIVVVVQRKFWNVEMVATK
jgi:uncharacterized membrane protein YeaQ/YmgE (transglycosylase-associated protein family)